VREQYGAAALHVDAFATAAASNGSTEERNMGLPPSSNTLRRIAVLNDRPAITDVSLNPDIVQERARPCETKNGADTTVLSVEMLL
jgi:hypothetical protein